MLPELTRGFIHSDSRGSLAFNNALDLSSLRRAYITENTFSEPFRGWHGHKLESKVFICVSGRIQVGAVKMADWVKPTGLEEIYSAVLSSDGLDAYTVPPGFSNGFLSLEPGSRLLILSDSDLKTSQADDFRFHPETWTLPNLD